MKPRLVETEHGQYEPAPFDGKNASGLVPLDDKVCVLPDNPLEKIGSIFVTKDTQNITALGAITGTVYAVGEEAKGIKPGDRVVFNRYSGQVIKGLDGKQYRIMSKANIGGLMLLEDAA